MENPKSIVYYILELIKILRQEYSSLLKETYFVDTNTSMNPLIKALLFFPFLLFWMFSASVTLCVLVISLAVVKGVKLVKNMISSPTPVNTLTTTVFNEFVIRDLLCEVLRDNAAELGVIRPKTVADITPTEYFVLQSVNNITFARFIVAYSSCEDEDFEVFLSLLNFKISQQLQIRYPGLILTYNDMKIVTVFDVAHDLYHNGYYSVDIMVVDNDAKYQYLKWWNYQKKAAGNTVDSSNLSDKDY